MYLRARNFYWHRRRISKAHFHRWRCHSLLHSMYLLKTRSVLHHHGIQHWILLEAVGQRRHIQGWSWRMLRQHGNRHLLVGIQSIHMLQQGRILARRLLNWIIISEDFFLRTLTKFKLILSFLFHNKILYSLNKQTCFIVCFSFRSVVSFFLKIIEMLSRSEVREKPSSSFNGN